MRAIAALLASAALTTGTLLASAGPASADTATAAKQLSYRFSDVKCLPTEIDFQVKQVERGKSGVTEFQQNTREQELVNGHWQDTGDPESMDSGYFNNDSTTHTYAQAWAYDRDETNSYRVVWVGYWFNGSQIQYQATKTVTCRA